MRTDDDTWDITTSVGVTAIGVAAMRAVETRRADALFRDPCAELLVRAADPERFGRLIDATAEPEGAGEGQTAVRVRAVMGGFMVARTCYFDGYFRDATAAGLRQIVILASGLDARAYRLEWPTGTTVFEIDQPKVLEFKSATLAEHGVEPLAELRTVAVDLRQDWPAALLADGFDPARPTAWLTEGLLRYLPAEAQDRLFDNVIQLSAPGSRIAANFSLETAEQATQQTRARVLAQLGLDLDVGQLWYPNDGRSDPAEWFAERGWIVTRTDATRVLTELGRSFPADADAAIGRHNLMTATLG
ncbi:class I SAM-dependent methyltransferase [Rhodococcus sp. D2-41]|uniref:class I SAM-dependent methyltransferase n=1 Tax=Speluncibacter jeojiensis TaxID=2710754 RepID=UPI00241027F5|nr:class I SAM-dependent methyltransferase [Rhodococcus sp. D2-41]MDG3009648.1 class I SAM-dependent methyltransferase [Rhodococcus sp. D2-41]